jgi:ankyrin repeat protein
VKQIYECADCATVQTGNTALRAATLLDDRDAVQALLGGGADPNKETVRGTALIAAAAEGNTKMLALLLDGGAHVNHQCDSGMPLIQ